jgi:uncharacterized membrane protein YoaK (UPF0700 family)
LISHFSSPDVAGYVRLFGIFTSSITGNLIVAASIVTGAGLGFSPRALCMIVFTFAGGVGASVAQSLRWRGHATKTVAIVLLGLELVLLVVSIIVGLLLDSSLMHPSTDIDSSSVLTLTLLLAAAMGVQCAAVKDCFKAAPATTVMTSNLINFSTCFSNACSAAMASLTHDGDELGRTALVKQRDEAARKLLSAFALIFSFVIGAIAGAFSSPYSASTWWSLVIPCVIILLMMIDIALAPAPVNVAADSSSVSPNQRSALVAPAPIEIPSPPARPPL